MHRILVLPALSGATRVLAELVAVCRVRLVKVEKSLRQPRMLRAPHARKDTTRRPQQASPLSNAKRAQPVASARLPMLCRSIIARCAHPGYIQKRKALRRVALAFQVGTLRALGSQHAIPARLAPMLPRRPRSACLVQRATSVLPMAARAAWAAPSEGIKVRLANLLALTVPPGRAATAWD
jgi:hypothetical protein